MADESDQIETAHADRAPLAPPVPAMIYTGRVAKVHTQADPLVYKSGPEYRRIDEIEKIVNLLPGTKVMIHHPPGEQMVETGTSHEVVGTVLSSKLDDDSAVAEILVRGESAMRAVRDASELSLAYYSKVDQSRHQFDTRLDHLAFVPRGRCGGACRVRLDAADLDVADDKCSCGMSGQHKHESSTEHADACGGTCGSGPACNNCAMMYTGQTMGNQAAKATEDLDQAGLRQARADHQGEIMEEIKQQLASAIGDAAKEKARADAAELALAGARTQITALEIAETNAKKDAQSHKDAADKAAADLVATQAQAKLDAADAHALAVDERVKLLVESAAILKKDHAELAKLDNRTLKVAVIKHVDHDDVPADKVEAYVDGVYEGAVRRHARGAASLAGTRVAVETARRDSAVTPNSSGFDAEANARAKMIAEANIQWANPATSSK